MPRQTLTCGIDFGTSNSTVALADQSLARLIALEDDHVTLPSAVFWHSDDPPEFGRAAIDAYVKGEEGRLMRGLKSTLGSSLINDRTRMGNRAVSFRDILARFFAELRVRLDAVQPGTEAVVLGRPVHFVEDDPAGDLGAQTVLGEIAASVGFREIGFQYEPIAAALHYESTIAAEELVLIVDIGGGTSDFSLVRVSPQRAKVADRVADILANDGIRVGGTDFDRLLSLASVMPGLGYLTTTGQGRAVMPRHYYLDLATWHRINFLYTQRIEADLKALAGEADHPERIARLRRVIAKRAGHGLAMAVEEAKIALSGSEAARLALSDLTGGPNPIATRADFEAAVAAPVARVGATMRSLLTTAGVRADQVGTVFMTGGSSGLPVLRALVEAEVPGVRIATGDMLGSVGTGLALDAARRFAGVAPGAGLAQADRQRR